MRSLIFFATMSLLALTACGDDSGGGGGAGGDGSTTGASATSSAAGTSDTTGAGASSFGEEDVARAFQTLETAGFTRITDGTLPTQHGVADSVAIWVTNAAVPQYREIDPTDADDTSEPFPEGTIIVKQNYAEDGSTPGSATVMAKMAPGFAAETSDWWWGRFKDDGTLAESGGAGDVDYCISCHEGNGLPRTDWLQGVAEESRLP